MLDDQPLELGLAELVGYLCLDDPAFTVVFDEAASEEVSWRDATGAQRVATVPRVTFLNVTGSGPR